ncbi:MAG: gliding motility-associated C-terminal domain-containing protein [Bacteroidales bacterium]|nr:gliding motility-associated C-terminal domain-containing protein [Bacteroidales bacterium]
MIGCCLTVPVHGQLTARYSDGKVPTMYNYPHRDTIFIFNQQPAPKKGDLSLQYRPASTIMWEKEAPSGEWVHYKTFTNVTQSRIDTLSEGNYRTSISNILLTTPDTEDFTITEPNSSHVVTVADTVSNYEWYRFDYATAKFETTAFATFSGVNSSEMSNLDEGGYMVKVITGDKRDSLVAWICMNPGFELKLQKDNNGAVYFSDKFCDRIDFRIDASHPFVLLTFTHYNPVSGAKSLWENDMTFTANGNYVFIGKHGNQQFFRIYKPPYEDTKYTFSAKDQFGMEQQDEIMYETIIPHSVITLHLPEAKLLADGTNSNPNSAPVDVRFENKSTNATEYVWRFGDGDSLRFGGDFPPHPDTVLHIYTIPKDYSAVLLVTNEYQCKDSSSVKIKVDPSKLDVGNVFSPNGDNINDYFKPDNTSIRQFEISIYTRAGKRVYQYKGGDLRYWNGWDGRINGGKEAAEGVYYYVLRAIGWDNLDYGWKDKKNETYRSYVYLYR